VTWNSFFIGVPPNQGFWYFCKSGRFIQSDSILPLSPCLPIYWTMNCVCN
jgi:hypothetical protein